MLPLTLAMINGLCSGALSYSVSLSFQVVLPVCFGEECRSEVVWQCSLDSGKHLLTTGNDKYSIHCLIHSLLLSWQALVECVSKWLTSAPPLQPEAEKRSPLSDRQLQPSSLPPERNPFKAPGKTDQTSEWKRLQDGGRLEDESKGKNEKGGEKERLHKSVGKESEHGRGMEEEEERGMSSPSESWRDKQLPAGMKIKKRVSGEENKESSETSPEEKEKTVKEMKDKNKNSNKDSQREAEKSNNSSPKPQDTEDPHKASKGHHGYYPREPPTNSLKE